ncbi:MAG TPA: protein kinase [Geothrix sp.]|nr:protein kinase [Geothrix sp.]
MPGNPGSGVLAPGTEIGRFQIRTLLGQGGMGAVYLAWDPVLERKVALKSIRLGEDGKAASTGRFRREAMALAQLNHRHVCQVHDWVESGGSAYIAMEFVEGETLAAAAPKMDLRQKLQALRAIAYALEAAHAKGIVHRDLKPSNVMIDGAGQIKVLDFGLARLVDSASAKGDLPTGKDVPNLSLLALPAGGATLSTSAAFGDGDKTSQGAADQPPSFVSSWGEMTEVGVFMGSPIYASPEQMGGKRVGPPSDVFSLGVVAWELLLGDHPFPGEGRARMTATVQGELKSLRGRKLPRRLVALLRGMLRGEALKRPTSRQVAESLSRQLNATPAAWWALGAAATLALVVGPGYYLFGRSIIADLGKEQVPRLAVMPIRNATGDPSLDALVGVGMTELLSIALHGSPSMVVMEPEAVSRVLTGLRMNPSEALEPAGQARIANALGARLLLRGTLRQDPGGTADLLSYELVDGNGRVRFSGLAKAPRQASFAPYALVDPAAHDLLRKVDPLRASAAQTAPVPPEVFAAYANGKALFLKGDFKGSEAYLREAAMKAPAFSSAVSGYAACLRRLGREQAVIVSNWALMSARATGDRWAEGRTLGLQAYLAKDQGQLDEAQRLREASLTLAKAIGDRDGETIAYNHLGLIAAERGRYAEADGFYEQSLQLSQATGDKVYESLAQNNLANLALKRGDLGTAESLYRTNLKLQQVLGNRWGEALALNNLGVVALMARNLPDAENLLTKALAAREAVGDKVGQVTCLRNLGILALMKDQAAESAAFHGRAMEQAQKLGLRTIEAECQFYKAELDRLQSRFVQAKEGYQRVLDLLPDGVTPEVRANAQAGLAECLIRKSRSEPKDAAKQLIGLAPAVSDTPYVHRAKAWLAFQAGQKEPALAELGLAMADPQRQAPEIRAELDQTRTFFLAKLGR